MAGKFEMTEDEYHEHCQCHDGICTECGEIRSGDVELDAEEYECESCGALAVMGMEYALLEDIISITDPEEAPDSDDAEDFPS